MGCNGDCDCACQGDQAGNFTDSEVNGLTQLLNYFGSTAVNPIGDPFNESAVAVDDDEGETTCGDIDCFTCYPATVQEYPYGQDVDGFGDYDFSEVVWPSVTDEQIDAAYEDIFGGEACGDPDCPCHEIGPDPEDDEYCDCGVCEDGFTTCNDLLYDRLIDIAVDPGNDAETSLYALTLGIQIGVIQIEEV